METDLNTLFTLIEKLNHPIKEVRSRSLKNICNKVKRSIVSIDELVHCPDALTNLLKWFNQDHVSDAETVLDLLLRITSSASGAQALLRIGAADFVAQLRPDLPNDQCRQLAASLLDALYRESSLISTEDERGGQSALCHYQPSPGAPAAVPGPASALNRPTIGYFDQSDSTAATHHITMVTSSDAVAGGDSSSHCYEEFRFVSFPVLPLTVTDRQVLGTALVSLKDADVSVCLGAIQFLRDVIFVDFPAELFLQRRGIIRSLQTILVSGDMSLIRTICECLTVFCIKLGERMRFHLDPNNHCSKDVFHIVTGGETEPNYSQRTRELVELDYDDTSSGGGVGGAGDCAVGSGQMSVQGFCVQLLDATLSQFIGYQTADLYPVLFRLLHAGVELLGDCLNIDPRPVNYLRTKTALDQLPETLDKWSRMTVRYGLREEKTPPDSALPRQIYLGLASTLLRLLGRLVPGAASAHLLSAELREELVVMAMDDGLMLGFHSVMAQLADYLPELDRAVFTRWRSLGRLGASMTAAVGFLTAKDEGLRNTELCLEHAANAVDCLAVVDSVEFVHQFVRFHSRLCSLEMFDDSLTPVQGRQILLRLMAHTNQIIRKASYSQIFDIVKESMASNEAVDPTSILHRRCLFLFDQEVLAEMVGFGVSSSNSDISELSELILLQLWESRPLLSNREWSSLMKSTHAVLPLLQCHANRETRLGRAVLSMSLTRANQTETASIDIMLAVCLRLLFSTNQETRNEAIDRLAELLRQEPGSAGKQPYFSDMNMRHLADLVYSEQGKAMERASTTLASVQVEGLRKVTDIFKSGTVDPQVRKSAGEQVGIFLQNPDLHSHFLSYQGLDFARDTIKKGVLRDAVSLTPLLVPCVAILRRLAHHNSEVRKVLVADTQLYYDVCRVGLYMNYDSGAKYEVSHLLAILVFADYAHSSESCPFSLPECVVSGYRLPFICARHDAVSPHQPAFLDGVEDIRGNEAALRSLRIRWAIANHAGLDQFVQEFKTISDAAYDDFTEKMRLTSLDRYLLDCSLPQLATQTALDRVTNATGHDSVLSGVDSLALLLVIVPSRELLTSLQPTAGGEEGQQWLAKFERFFRVQPSCSADLRLLDRLLGLLESYMRHQAGGGGDEPTAAGPSAADRSFLLTCVLRPEGPVVYCLQRGLAAIGETDSVNLVEAKRKMAVRIVLFFHNLVQFWTASCQPDVEQHDQWTTLLDIITKCMIQHLEAGILTPFDNLNTMQYVVEILVNISACDAWLAGREALVSSQLATTSLEYMSVFQAGRQEGGVSFMGLGVLRGLLHLLNNLAACQARAGRLEENRTVWLEKAWLLPYWSYRDVETRALALSIAGRLCSWEPLATDLALQMRRLLPSSGLWPAALTLLADSREASVVRAHAASLLTVLLSRPLQAPPGSLADPTGPLTELLQQSDLLHVAGVILSHYYPFPVLRPDDPAVARPDITGSSSSASAGHLSLSQQPADDTATLEAILRRSTSTTTAASSSRSTNTTSNSRSTSGTTTGSGSVWTGGVQVGSQAALTTPLLVSGVCSVVQNLLHHLPDLVLPSLSRLRLNTLLMNIIEPNLVSIYLRCGGPRYRPLTVQICRAYEGCLRVVRLEAGLDSAFRHQLGHDDRFITCLVRLLEIKGPVTVLGPLWSQVFHLLVTLLHPDPGTPAALHILTPLAARAEHLVEAVLQIIGQQSTTAGSSTKQTALHSLAVLLCRASPRTISCSTQVSGVHGNPLVAVLDSDSDDDGGPPLAERLVLALMTHRSGGAGPSSLRDTHHILQQRLALHNALKVLVAVSSAAKTTAVTNGLVESEVTLIKYLHGKLDFGVAALGKLSPSTSPLLTELLLTLDLLHNLCHASLPAKMAAVNAGLPGLAVTKLWPLALQLGGSLPQPTGLLVGLLRCLVNLTAQCPRACVALVGGGGGGGVSEGGVGAGGGLLAGLCRLIGGDKGGNSETLGKLGFTLLANLVLTPEARKALWKTKFLSKFSHIHPKSLQKKKSGQLLQFLWLRVLVNLSFSEEGQQQIMQIPDSLDVLTLQVEVCQGKTQEMALLVVRNLCTNSALKAKLLAAELKLIPCLSQFLRSDNVATCTLVLSTLKALMENNQKARVYLKTQGFLQPAMTLWETCQNDPNSPILADIQEVLCALQD